MKEIDATFTSPELIALKALIGQEFKCIGGPEVPDFLVSDSFVIGTSSSAVEISAEVKAHHVDPGSEEFSKLIIDVPDDEYLDKTLKSGNMYLLDRRNLITGISIVRETLESFEEGVASWLLRSDVALVIHLVKGDIVIRQVSLSVEAIAAEYVDEFTLSVFEKPSNRFENELFPSLAPEFEIISMH